jgi:hypothetical protein
MGYLNPGTAPLSATCIPRAEMDCCGAADRHAVADAAVTVSVTSMNDGWGDGWRGGDDMGAGVCVLGGRRFVFLPATAPRRFTDTAHALPALRHSRHTCMVLCDTREDPRCVADGSQGAGRAVTLVLVTRPMRRLPPVRLDPP